MPAIQAPFGYPLNRRESAASSVLARAARHAASFATLALALALGLTTAPLVSFARPAVNVEAASEAPAQADSTYSLTGDLATTLTVTSDYRFRGVSRSFGDPAVQGGAEFAMPSRFYFGVWASTVDKQIFADSAGIETHLYGGYRTRILDTVELDAGLLQYIYLAETDLNTLEAYIKGTWQYFTIGYFHTLSNNFFQYGDARHSTYASALVRFPLAPTWTALGHYGYQRIEGEGTNYQDYLIGIEKDWRGFDWRLMMVGADSSVVVPNIVGRTKDLADRRLVLSVSYDF